MHLSYPPNRARLGQAFPRSRPERAVREFGFARIGARAWSSNGARNSLRAMVDLWCVRHESVRTSDDAPRLAIPARPPKWPRRTRIAGAIEVRSLVLRCRAPTGIAPSRRHPRFCPRLDAARPRPRARGSGRRGHRHFTGPALGAPRCRNIRPRGRSRVDCGSDTSPLANGSGGDFRQGSRGRLRDVRAGENCRRGRVRTSTQAPRRAARCTPAAPAATRRSWCAVRAHGASRRHPHRPCA